MHLSFVIIKQQWSWDDGSCPIWVVNMRVIGDWSGLGLPVGQVLAAEATHMRDSAQVVTPATKQMSPVIKHFLLTLLSSIFDLKEKKISNSITLN